MAKNFHNGTNIIVKQYIIFLGENIFELFIALAIKTHLSVLAQKIPAIYLEQEVCVIKKFWKNI
jgi:hypothetical protein